jgi:hypothetical protein
MDQGRDRRRAFHRVRQPGVQPELRRLAHGADKKQQADDGQRVEMIAEEEDFLADQRLRLGEDRVIGDRADHQIDGENSEREAEIADAIDQERLDRRRVRLRLLVPEADQQITRETHALPAEEQLHEVVRRHQHQHGEGEEREIGEETRLVRVFFHVSDGINVHERRHVRHDDKHHRDQRIDAQRPVDLQAARRDPGEQPDPRLVPVEPGIDKDEPGKQRDHDEQAARDEARPARANLTPEQARDQEADQRQEYDCLDHASFSPSSD